MAILGKIEKEYSQQIYKNTIPMISLEKSYHLKQYKPDLGFKCRSAYGKFRLLPALFI